MSTPVAKLLQCTAHTPTLCPPSSSRIHTVCARCQNNNSPISTPLADFMQRTVHPYEQRLAWPFGDIKASCRVFNITQTLPCPKSIRFHHSPFESAPLHLSMPLDWQPRRVSRSAPRFPGRCHLDSRQPIWIEAARVSAVQDGRPHNGKCPIQMDNVILEWNLPNPNENCGIQMAKPESKWKRHHPESSVRGGPPHNGRRRIQMDNVILEWNLPNPNETCVI